MRISDWSSDVCSSDLVLTAWIIGKTNRFKAAATQKPVIDWASFALTADAPFFFSQYWFGEYPWEDPQAYWNRSPLSLVGTVNTPTLVVVGSEDYRTPVSEAEQIGRASGRERGGQYVKYTVGA